MDMPRPPSAIPAVCSRGPSARSHNVVLLARAPPALKAVSVFWGRGASALCLFSPFIFFSSWGLFILLLHMYDHFAYTYPYTYLERASDLPGTRLTDRCDCHAGVEWNPSPLQAPHCSQLLIRPSSPQLFFFFLISSQSALVSDSG